MISVEYPNGTGTATTYDYDDMYRPESVFAYVGSQKLFANYTYTDDLLTGIETGSTAYTFTYGVFGLRSSVKAGTRTLASYAYTYDPAGGDRNKYLKELVYGNGNAVEYTYDSYGRVIGETYKDAGDSTPTNERDTVTYKYDNDGFLASVTDSESDRTTGYSYDLSGRLVKYREKGTDYDHSVSYTYDQENNLTQLTEKIGTATHTTGYEYDSDNRIEKVTADGGTAATADDIAVAYTYDGFGRVSGQTVKYGTETVLTRQPGYDKTTGAATTDAQIDTYTVKNKNGATIASYSYTYDANGNILSVSDGTNTTTYTYDSQNQLIRERNQQAGKIWEWTYDNAGNIQTKKQYNYSTGALEDTVNYGYTETGWKDLLTSYDGTAVTYDGIGNPAALNGRSYTWEHGRELRTVTYGGATWTNTYDANGIRTQRVNNSTGKAYSYTYNGSLLTRMTVGTNTLVFTYDATGTPVSVTRNGTDTYYYVTNLQGDVVAILDDSGNKVTEYTYDAWGKLLTVTGSEQSGIGTLNPLMYRGYVYDYETGLYYLQSRYYDPEVGRFINADVLASTKNAGIGCNVFVYCYNNSVNYCDRNGFDAIWIQESESAEGFGHSGLMVQDDEGNWFFFYWGPTDETPSKDLVLGVDNGSYIQEIKTNGADMRDIDEVCSVLVAAGGKAGGRASEITDIYYFEGDYTATLEEIIFMVDSGEKYELLTNNCVQKTIEAFSASDSRFSMATYSTMTHLIPNRAAYKVAMIPSNKNAYPWKLAVYNLIFE